ncbi:MAG: glycosyltransferase, partial [Flavisolibacter sp.]
MKNIMIFTDWFEPGYKAGGPIRSSLNFARLMKTTNKIFVFTADRDLNDEHGYANVLTNQWSEFEEGIEIYYCSPENLSWSTIKEQYRKLMPGFIYLNSMFSIYFTILPLLIMWKAAIKKQLRIMIAPCGMLKKSALQIKAFKKRCFLYALRVAGLHRIVHFHATDQNEGMDVFREFGNQTHVVVAGDFPATIPRYNHPLLKMPGILRIIFISRIHPIKNLEFLLRLLPHVKGIIHLTIVGLEEDKTYATNCKAISEKFPARISVRYIGHLPNKEIEKYLKSHHILALPTKGENFGHSIFEALSHSRPVLISNQTPWHNLQTQKAGWDLPLSDTQGFISAIQQAVDFNKQEFFDWSYNAWKYANNQLTRNNSEN